MTITQTDNAKTTRKLKINNTKRKIKKEKPEK